MSGVRFSEVDVGNSQRKALLKLFELVVRSQKHPEVRELAIQIVNNCAARDDMCELKAIFDCIKRGDPAIAGFENGVKYMTDPDLFDHYTAPWRLIDQCQRGICAEDCDGHSALVAALCMSLGFKAGLRIYKPKGEQFYSHVYAVVGYPKLEPKSWLGMDTTVPQSRVGWEPPNGDVLTAHLPNEN